MVDEHPDHATLERHLSARLAGIIHIDVQQIAEGKSAVAAYSVREWSGGRVSAPLEWRELRRTPRSEAFTIKTMPGHVRRLGDLWGAAMKRRNTRRAIDRVSQD